MREHTIGSTQFTTGIQSAFWAVVLWALALSFNNIILNTYDIHPVLFAGFSFFYASCTMFLVAGIGKVSWKTFAHPSTWAFGMSRIILLALFNIALLALSATEIEFINRVGILFSIVLSFVFLKKRPFGMEWPIIGLFTLCSLYMFVETPADLKWAFLVTVLAAFINAYLVLIIELHPASNQSINTKDRLRFTSVMIFASSICFTALTVLVSLFLPENSTSPLGQALLKIAFVESPSLLWDTNLHIFSFLIGGLLIAPVLYARFYTIRILGSENTLLAGTLIPFATLGIESVFHFFGLLEIPTLEARNIVIGIFMTICAIGLLLIRLQRSLTNPTKK